MEMSDDPLLNEAASVADRRPTPSASESDGLRLIDQLVRVFGAHSEDSPEAGALFTWGTLEVKEKLASGSFGDVFAAWDPTLHREVALKLRTPEVGALRWLDEARNVARVRHPHVLTVYGADVLEGRAGIWTELIAGQTLEHELQNNGPFSQHEALRVGRDIASALSAVHATGLVHGDVKTDNIMLEDGAAPRRAVLVDFGTADEMLPDGEVPAYLIGTPLTMAPEVLDGQPATGSSDVYGLGVTLFRLLTGRYPVQAETIDALRRAHATGAKVSLRSVAPSVSPRLARVIERALEPSPGKRWPSADAFRRALDDVADPTRRIRARAAAIGAGVAVLAAIVVFGVLLSRPGAGPLARGRMVAPSSPGLLREAWRRPGDGANLGYHYTAGSADVDGDGHDDLLVAQSRWQEPGSRGYGRVAIFFGNASGLDSTSDVAITVADTSYILGTGVARAGDVNRDGYQDFLVAEQTPYTLIGRASLYPGGPRGRTPAPVWAVTGSSYDSGLGRTMMAAGDVNGDRYDDVVIGECRAYNPLVEEGVNRLYLGSSNGLSPTPAWTATGGQEHMELGSLMGPTGDVNGDGYNDILLGAQLWDGAKGANCGLARLYFGHVSGASAEPVWSYEGDGPGFLLGCAVSGAGDVNGDGFDDLIIGERLYSDEKRPERGRVLIFHGGPRAPSAAPDWVAFGPVSYARFGYYLAGVGDVDADGFDDVAIGAPNFTQGTLKNCGFVEVYRGGRNGCESRPAWRVVGDRSGALTGNLVTAADLNGDHRSDLIVRAMLWGDSVPERGLLVTYLGRTR
jgi:hypothetical protein